MLKRMFGRNKKLESVPDYLGTPKIIKTTTAIYSVDFDTYKRMRDNYSNPVLLCWHDELPLSGYPTRHTMNPSLIRKSIGLYDDDPYWLYEVRNSADFFAFFVDDTSPYKHIGNFTVSTMLVSTSKIASVRNQNTGWLATAIGGHNVYFMLDTTKVDKNFPHWFVTALAPTKIKTILLSNIY